MACLEDVHEVLGDRRVAVCRELTKLHEEVQRGTVSEVLRALGRRPVRGEVTVVVEGAAAPTPSADRVEAALRERLAQGAGVREAAQAVAAALGVPRRQAYRLALALQEEVQRGG